MGMGSKNVSISEDAYLILRRARRHPGESFSQVIRRGHWDSTTPIARSWLDSFQKTPIVSDAVLDDWEAAQNEDTPPKDKWA